MKPARVLAIVLAFVMTAEAGETGIKNVVQMFETHYATRHHAIHWLWLARPFLLGSGVSGLKMAEFHDLQGRAPQSENLSDEVGRTLGPDWSLFVESWERGGEWSLIYARTSGRGMKMLMVSADQGDEVTLVQLTVSRKALDGRVDEPVETANRTNHEIPRE
jgi:hypothetical protein